MHFAQTLELIRMADALFRAEDNILNIEGPTKIFGDIHGQFDDMCRLFKAFGSPDHHIGDIEENSYVFLGDIVDRGRHSLEV
jgi:protein phosphatase